MPDFEEGKVLGIPVITNIIGEEQARTMFAFRNKWEISDNVRFPKLEVVFAWKTTLTRSCLWPVGITYLKES